MNKKGNNNSNPPLWLDSIFVKVKEIAVSVQPPKYKSKTTKFLSSNKAIIISLLSLSLTIGIFLNTREFNIKFNPVNIRIAEYYSTVDNAYPDSLMSTEFGVNNLFNMNRPNYTSTSDVFTSWEDIKNSSNSYDFQSNSSPSNINAVVSSNSITYKISRLPDSGYLNKTYFFIKDSVGNFYHSKPSTVKGINAIDPTIPTFGVSMNTNTLGKDEVERQSCAPTLTTCYIHILKMTDITSDITISSMFLVFQGYNETYQIIPILFKETHITQNINATHNELYSEILIESSVDLYSESTWYSVPGKFINQDLLDYCSNEQSAICLSINKNKNENNNYQSFKSWYKEDTISAYEEIKKMLS